MKIINGTPENKEGLQEVSRLLRHKRTRVTKESSGGHELRRLAQGKESEKSKEERTHNQVNNIGNEGTR